MSFRSRIEYVVDMMPLYLILGSPVLVIAGFILLELFGPGLIAASPILFIFVYLLILGPICNKIVFNRWRYI